MRYALSRGGTRNDTSRFRGFRRVSRVERVDRVEGGSNVDARRLGQRASSIFTRPWKYGTIRMSSFKGAVPLGGERNEAT